MAKKKESGGMLRYVGQGVCIGVPARDLTPDEVAHFGRDWLLKLRCPNTGGPLYEPAADIQTTQEVEIESEVKDG